MWTRVELKTNAKEVLRRTYWMGLGVCLVSGFLGGITSGGSSNYRMINELNNPVIYLIVFLFAIFGIVYSIFVGSPVLVGKNDYFMSSREYDPSFMKLFSSFTKGKSAYFNIVKAMFIKDLFLFLWFLLLIVPGIIKSYEYIFVPYILSENPNISYSRAIELSREMTRGYKFDIFVLGLSFLGWQLLGILACCIGVVFVAPYVEATYAELYAAHREKALAEGYTDTNELCGY